MENTHYVRATEGFFVRGRGPDGRGGIVNPGEVVSLLKSEKMDVTAANRGVEITQKEYEQGTKADFVAKDAEGKPIPVVERSRAQIHAAARAAQAQAQTPLRQPSIKGAN
jgi:hypothetical protein